MSMIGAFVVPHPPLILPKIGKGQEKQIEKTIAAYRQIARTVASLKPDTVVISSPHAALYADYFHISPGRRAQGSLSQFGSADAIEVAYDAAFASELEQAAAAAHLPAGTLGQRDPALDHGTYIPLHFLRESGVDCQVVRLGLSGLPPIAHYRLGKCVAQTAEKLSRRVVFIASGDLSHKLKTDGPYGFSPEGPKFDRQIADILSKGDFLKLLTIDPVFAEKAAECGLRSFIILAGTLDGLAVKPQLLSYEGTFGVGYLVCAFQVAGTDEARRFDVVYEQQERSRLKAVREQEDGHVRLARLALETFIKTGKRADLPKDLPAEMLQKKAGVFVSIKKYGQLRGCIGTIAPTAASIAEEIAQNAISAGLQDSRFEPVNEEELPDLVYSVDVLQDPEPIGAQEELDVFRYGVIVTSGRRRGLLLPNLEGVETPEQQVAIALQKAGIHPSAPYTLERFEVVRHR